MSGIELPASALPECSACHRLIKLGERIAREVTGWDVPRKGGGHNHLLGRKETGRLLCPRCTHDLKAPQQGGLW